MWIKLIRWCSHAEGYFREGIPGIPLRDSPRDSTCTVTSFTPRQRSASCLDLRNSHAFEINGLDLLDHRVMEHRILTIFWVFHTADTGKSSFIHRFEREAAITLWLLPSKPWTIKIITLYDLVIMLWPQCRATSPFHEAVMLYEPPDLLQWPWLSWGLRSSHWTLNYTQNWRLPLQFLSEYVTTWSICWNCRRASTPE